jgi:hypothetical protein
VSPVKYELGIYIQEYYILHSDRRENLKSYIRVSSSPLDGIESLSASSRYIVNGASSADTHRRTRSFADRSPSSADPSKGEYGLFQRFGRSTTLGEVMTRDPINAGIKSPSELVSTATSHKHIHSIL